MLSFLLRVYNKLKSRQMFKINTNVSNWWVQVQAKSIMTLSVGSDPIWWKLHFVFKNCNIGLRNILQIDFQRYDSLGLRPIYKRAGYNHFDGMMCGFICLSLFYDDKYYSHSVNNLSINMQEKQFFIQNKNSHLRQFTSHSFF